MALGDKKRAVMTTDINNSGSDYPVLGPTGDGSNVTAAFTAAGTRTNISTGEKLGVIFGKIAKWFADLGTAAFRGVDTTPTANSTNLVESGGVKIALTPVDFANATVVSASGEDLDNYTSGGVWWFTTNASPANRPTGAAKYGYLFVLCAGSTVTRLQQIWVDITRDDDNVYIRSNNVSPVSWGAWKRFTTDVDVGAIGATLSWTPKLYDYTTYLQDLPTCSYWKVGGLYVAEFHTTIAADAIPQFSTMLQVRNLPFNTVIGGSISNGVSGGLADRVIQGNVSYVYPRPNITQLSAGQLSGMIIGY